MLHDLHEADRVARATASLVANITQEVMASNISPVEVVRQLVGRDFRGLVVLLLEGKRLLPSLGEIITLAEDLLFEVEGFLGTLLSEVGLLTVAVRAIRSVMFLELAYVSAPANFQLVDSLNEQISFVRRLVVLVEVLSSHLAVRHEELLE